MSYVPTNWQTGDTITAEKLNNEESGIVSANPFIITVNTSDMVQYQGMDCFGTDTNYDELVNALKSGRLAYVKYLSEEEGMLDFQYILVDTCTIYDDPSTPSSISAYSGTFSIASAGETATVSMNANVYNIIENTETESHANCLISADYHSATVTGTPVE